MSWLYLHLEGSTKSSCCVVPHQALHVTLHLQTSIKKLSFESPYTLDLVTLLSILELPYLSQALPLKQAKFLTATATPA